MPFRRRKITRAVRRRPAEIRGRVAVPQGLFASEGGCKTMDVRVDTAASADPAPIMTTGGDGRIDVDPATKLNRYHSAPRPSEALAYASSTANDISPQAFAHVGKVLA